MPTGKSILTRVVLGTAMVAVTGGVLIVEHLDVVASELADVRGAVLAAVFVVLGVLAFRELRRLADAAGIHLLPVSGMGGAVLLGTMPFWRQLSPFFIGGDDVWAVLGVVVVAVFLEQMVRYRVEAAIPQVGATLLAVLYLAVGTAIVLLIRLDLGVPVIVLFLAAVKSADIGAYFTGVAIGRHKLIGWLSPGKTWEGLLGGLAVAAGASVLVVALCRLRPGLDLHLPLWKAGIFGAVVGLAGQFADLCESLLKRSAQVKDSGALVPEFGGVLDVLDSPLLAAPVAYVLLYALP